ncbi:hypothetical protein AN191_16590 [Loktanella sp. 5RATIMAR09]|nr:hypothetical protein AN191_16590 [Loktanella sp. 5RATIMAR09]
MCSSPDIPFWETNLDPRAGLECRAEATPPIRHDAKVNFTIVGELSAGAGHARKTGGHTVSRLAGKVRNAHARRKVIARGKRGSVQWTKDALRCETESGFNDEIGYPQKFHGRVGHGLFEILAVRVVRTDRAIQPLHAGYIRGEQPVLDHLPTTVHGFDRRIGVVEFMSARNLGAKAIQENSKVLVAAVVFRQRLGVVAAIMPKAGLPEHVHFPLFGISPAVDCSNSNGDEVGFQPLRRLAAGFVLLDDAFGYLGELPW